MKVIVLTRNINTSGKKKIYPQPKTSATTRLLMRLNI